MTPDFITPTWPVPSHIKAISTTRQRGFSLPPYASLNLGTHVGDDLAHVSKNRTWLEKQALLPESPRWLEQVHGDVIIDTQAWSEGTQADAIMTTCVNHVCPIMTADCLPILLCDTQGKQVAAIHAGWRSLAAGIVEKTLNKFSCAPNQIIAWLGPAIGPSQFEVGHDVFKAFTLSSDTAAKAFQQTDDSHFLANIYLLATQKLNQYGTQSVFGGKHCTVSEQDDFFSYRRDGITGRMATMIWIAPK